MKLEELRQLVNRNYNKDSKHSLYFADQDLLYVNELLSLVPPLLAIAEWGKKLASYVEECYPGIKVTESIRDALKALEEAP